MASLGAARLRVRLPAPRSSRLLTTRCGAAPPPLPSRLKLVGLGSAGIDYMAPVAAFPAPDAKIRTSQPLSVQGGGNAANALVAAARLGLEPALFSKLGNDANGDAIVAELEAEGVDTRAVLRGEGSSPFTYIIVDQQANTRTCIHTPGAARGARRVRSGLTECPRVSLTLRLQARLRLLRS